MAINDGEDHISKENKDDYTRSMIDKNDHMDVEVERRMSKLIVDIDGVGEEKTKREKRSQKRIHEEFDIFSLQPRHH